MKSSTKLLSLLVLASGNFTVAVNKDIRLEYLQNKLSNKEKELESTTELSDRIKLKIKIIQINAQIAARKALIELENIMGNVASQTQESLEGAVEEIAESTAQALQDTTTAIAESAAESVQTATASLAEGATQAALGAIANAAANVTHSRTTTLSDGNLTNLDFTVDSNMSLPTTAIKRTRKSCSYKKNPTDNNMVNPKAKLIGTTVVNMTDMENNNSMINPSNKSCTLMLPTDGDMGTLSMIKENNDYQEVTTQS